MTVSVPLPVPRRLTSSAVFAWSKPPSSTVATPSAGVADVGRRRVHPLRARAGDEEITA